MVLGTKERSRKRPLSEFDEMTQELPWYMKVGEEGSQDAILAILAELPTEKAPFGHNRGHISPINQRFHYSS